MRRHNLTQKKTVIKTNAFNIEGENFTLVNHRKIEPTDWTVDSYATLTVTKSKL